MKKVKLFLVGLATLAVLSIGLHSCGGSGGNNSSSSSKSTVCTSCAGRGYTESVGCPASCLNRQAALPCKHHKGRSERIKCYSCDGSGKTAKGL